MSSELPAFSDNDTSSVAAAAQTDSSDEDGIIYISRSPSPILLVDSPEDKTNLSSENNCCAPPIGDSSAGKIGSTARADSPTVPSDWNLDLASGSLRNPFPVASTQTVAFDPSSLLESLSDDEFQVAPPESTNNSTSLDQQVDSHASLDLGFQAEEKNSNARPDEGLRSILKIQKPLNSIEKIIDDCLKLLCTTDDKYEVFELIRSNTSKVFKGLCSDQFFQKGECFSSTCDDHHQYVSHKLSQCDEELWYASLYIICHARMPNRQIVENFFQHYAAKGSLTLALLFTKCIAKVRETDRLELAHFCVNQLSGTMPMRDVITIVLMLNFPELSCMRYNMLMEGLRLLEQNTTDYSELFTFLNFHQHQMPARFIVKLMEDTMKYSNKGMVESISGFLRRLHPCHKDEVLPVATEFIKLFGILPSNEDSQPFEKRSKIGKKRVVFAVDPDVREFDVEDTTENQNEADEGDFSDDDNVDNVQPSIPNFDGSPDQLTERIVRVFGDSCCVWLLNGQCPNPVCSLIHDFDKDSLAGLPSEDVCVAADFIIAQSVTPSIDILKTFIASLAESNNPGKVLMFRNCTSKLNNEDNLKLTDIIISTLGKQMTRWDAIEKVLVPNVVEMRDSEDDHQFFFDAKLLYSIMSEAIETRTSVMRCVTRALLKLVSKLPSRGIAEMAPITSSYMEKFVLNERELPQSPDFVRIRIEPNGFESSLKVALYQGVSSNYFLATIMMMQVVDGALRDHALDILHHFLLSNFDRARVLAIMLENCHYFGTNMKKSKEFIGTGGLNTVIRLYENENYAGAAELLSVMKSFNLNIFTLPASHGDTTAFNMAIIYCIVTVDTAEKNDIIDVFFSRLVDPFLASSSPKCPPELIHLTAKMFQVLTEALLVEESLKLYKGIIGRQKSLVKPLNIVEFVEPTLRCSFHRSQDAKIRQETIKLYLDAVEGGSPITFEKITHRSMFLISLKEITCATLTAGVRINRDVLHPLMKKMLISCIKEGAYHDITTLQINICSSMIDDEIEVYLLWWFALYNRARKRAAVDYYSLVTVKIIEDVKINYSGLPVYESLRNVSVSITNCAQRVTSVIQKMIGEPLSLLSADRTSFYLHPSTVKAASQTAINTMIQHGYIKSERSLCTRCFDSINLDLNGTL